MSLRALRRAAAGSNLGKASGHGVRLAHTLVLSLNQVADIIRQGFLECLLIGLDRDVFSALRLVNGGGIALAGDLGLKVDPAAMKGTHGATGLFGIAAEAHYFLLELSHEPGALL